MSHTSLSPQPRPTTQHAPNKPRRSKIGRLLTRLLTRHLAVVGVMLIGTAVQAADPPTPQDRYQADRAACLQNNPHMDRDACLKEAGAALQESKKSGAVKSSGPHSEQNFVRNRTLRCDALPLTDREDCLRRMQGEGVIEGSVEAGGVLRQLERPIASPPAQ